MSEQESNEPFKKSHLDSVEYRERLMRKLNCLIAVLEVATRKVRVSLDGPEADVERLTRIQGNLSTTLQVCRRAKAALERREELPDGLPENLARLAAQNAEFQKGTPQKSKNHLPRPKRKGIPRGSDSELTSPLERYKFERMGRIRKSEFASCDVDELSRRLQG